MRTPREASVSGYKHSCSPSPTQTLHVEFARLQDVPDYENFKRLYQCNLCDTINVVFPDYKSTGQFKIVKTVWDVLKDRYDSMELGDLSISLSQALGINNSSSYSGSGSPSADVDKVVEEGSTSNGSYRKWDSGILECWISTSKNVALNSAYGSVYTGQWIWTYPVPFISDPTVTCSQFKWRSGASWGMIAGANTTIAYLQGVDAYSRASGACAISAYAIGKWK